MSDLKTTVLDKIGRMIERADSWINPLTSFGTARDKTAAAYYQLDADVSDEELSAMFHGDDMARKIVEIVPREALRQEFKLTSTPPEDALKLGAKCKALDLRNKFKEGWTWGRLYGGCLMWLGVDDGQDPSFPLNVNTIQSFTFLSLYDKRRAFPARYYTDPKNPKYGQPEVWTLNGLEGGIAQVHETRTLIFRGALTGDREKKQRQSWDHSVLQGCYRALRHFHTNINAAELLMSDASQAVFKMRGLLAHLASPGGMANLQTRAALLDTSRSVARSIMLDAEGGEEFTRIATSFAGVADMLDRAANRLAAASEIPVTLLMGQAPAGLNATGESDVRVFYDRIKSDQDNILRPLLEKAFQLIKTSERIAAPVTLSFESLWQETPKEKAERRKLVADVDAIYIDREVYTPDECAESRFGGESWSDETKLDLSLRGTTLPTLPGSGGPREAPGTPAKASGPVPPG